MTLLGQLTKVKHSLQLGKGIAVVLYFLTMIIVLWL